MPYLSLTLRDDFGRETVKRFELVPQSTLAEYDDACEAIVDALALITDLGIVRHDLVLTAFVSGGGTIAEGANVDVGATFVGEIDGGNGKKASHKVPGIHMTYVGADGSIDVTQEDIAAYLGLFLDGTGVCLISDGEDMDVWLTGRLDR